jgi:DNA uptake protein ComE-like DNA-binding protein
LPKEEPVETFPFDPNTADSTMLLRLGLAPWQVRSIYRYRAKHGRYHTPEDFMRVPGMTNEQWERLKPCIRIDKKYQYIAPLQTSPRGGRLPSQSVHEELIDADTIQGSPTSSREGSGEVVKLAPGQTVDINTADTALLKMIPGIASKRAARIVAYRRALGGFVSIEQAMEAIDMPDSVLNYMTVSSLPVQKINVNKLSVQQMMKHPYLNFYQAKAIFEHRRNNGELHSIEELSRLEGFRSTDIDRLRPYVEF